MRNGSARPTSISPVGSPICWRSPLSHQRLAEAARRDAAARETAAQLEAQVATLTRELESRTGQRRVVGHSQQWKDVLAQAARVAQTETTVLLTGESGTGKEVVARFIHQGSRRKNGPFVAINCAALPDQLLESELFGHERGAFTGAVAAKPGRIEQANGGVLFLDEVGEMAPTVQAKLLRVLEEREFMRLGSTRSSHADIRVVAATNRDLHAAMRRGEFREDLYYRLSVFEIALPPLRDRLDDILELADAFLEEIGGAVGKPPAGIAREAQGPAPGVPVAGQRSRAAECHRARRHPRRRRLHQDRAPARHRAARLGRRSPVGERRPPRFRPAASTSRISSVRSSQGADAGAIQQDARGQAARADARAALFAHRKIRARRDRQAGLIPHRDRSRHLAASVLTIAAVVHVPDARRRDLSGRGNRDRTAPVPIPGTHWSTSAIASSISIAPARVRRPSSSRRPP